MINLSFLDNRTREEVEKWGNSLTGIRLRAGRRIQLDMAGASVLLDVLSVERFREIVSSLVGHSLYAKEDELARGYIPLDGGSRAGVSGAGSISSVNDIGSVCIRIAKEVRGAADKIIDSVETSTGTLIVSPPGLGKTTMLRDVARQLSDRGMNICVLDERGELAACAEGAPTLDVGQRTDVIFECAKSRAALMAIRSLSPDVIVTDEIGSESETMALLDASRCGVKIVATAHGTSLDINKMRSGVKLAVAGGAFDYGVLLGPGIGEVRETVSYSHGAARRE